MKKALLALALLSGCASSRQIGPGLFTIECRRNRSNCYEEAARVCPNGFQTLDGSEQTGAYAMTNASYYGNNAQAQTTVVPTYQGEMLVRCASAREEGSEWTDTPSAATPEPVAAPAPKPVAEPETVKPVRGLVDDVPFPERVAGFHFGATPEEFGRICQESGGVFSEELIACSQAPVQLPVPVNFVAANLCDGHVCEIWFSVPLQHIEQMRAALRRKYGDPNTSAADDFEDHCTLPSEIATAHRDIWFFGPRREDGKLSRAHGMLRVVRDCPEGKGQIASVWYDNPLGIRMRFKERIERDESY